MVGFIWWMVAGAVLVVFGAIALVRPMLVLRGGAFLYRFQLRLLLGADSELRTRIDDPSQWHLDQARRAVVLMGAGYFALGTLTFITALLGSLGLLSPA